MFVSGKMSTVCHKRNFPTFYIIELEYYQANIAKELLKNQSLFFILYVEKKNKKMEACGRYT